MKAYKPTLKQRLPSVSLSRKTGFGKEEDASDPTLSAEHGLVIGGTSIQYQIMHAVRMLDGIEFDLVG